MRKIKFEGFADQTPSSDFGMLVVMMRPIIQIGDCNNASGAENMVQDYIIDLSCGYVPEMEYISGAGKRMFYRARKGEAGKNIVYWKQEVELPDDIEAEDAFNKIKYITPMGLFIKGKKLK